MPRTKKTIVADNVAIEPLITQQTESPSPNQEDQALEKDLLHTPVSDSQETVNAVPAKTKRPKKSEAAAPVILPEPVAAPHKPKFKQVHIKDTYWLENDIYQTLIDITDDDRNAKAEIINQALRDYLKKKKIAIKPFVAKDK